VGQGNKVKLNSFDIRIGSIEGKFLYSNIQWNPKSMTKPTQIIIHSTGETVKQVYLRNIKKNGQPKYHFIIDNTGDITQMLPLNMTGTHTKNHSEYSFGIGLLNLKHNKPPSLAMRYSFSQMIKYLNIRYKPLKLLTQFQIKLWEVNQTANRCQLEFPEIDEKYYIRNGFKDLSEVNIQLFKKKLNELVEKTDGDKLAKEMLKISIDQIKPSPGHLSQVLF